MPTSLVDLVERAFVVSYQEDVSVLLRSLSAEGLAVTSEPATYTSAELAYPRQSRCLLSHLRVWLQCREREGVFMVAEADFVPVAGFGRLPLPFGAVPPSGVFAWLYAVSPTFYREDSEGYVVGDSSSTVCYLVDAVAAAALVDLFNERFSRDLMSYTPWDANIGPYLRRQRGIPTYTPFRQYGEHGGPPNPEHRQLGGMPAHRADCLFARLAFLPAYAEGRRSTLLATRAKAKLRGLARVLLCRAVRWEALRRQGGLRLLVHATSRLLTPY